MQHGYGRPAITAGNTRVCVYNRAGKELRVESRSRTLFENKFDDAIQLCAMSPNGTLAVFTKSKLNVYDPMFENIYHLPDAGPAYSSSRLPADNRQFAAGCPYAEGGALGGTVYLMDTRKDEVCHHSQYRGHAREDPVPHQCRGAGAVRYVMPRCTIRGRRNRVVRAIPTVGARCRARPSARARMRCCCLATAYTAH